MFIWGRFLFPYHTQAPRGIAIAIYRDLHSGGLFNFGLTASNLLALCRPSVNGAARLNWGGKTTKGPAGESVQCHEIVPDQVIVIIRFPYGLLIYKHNGFCKVLRIFKDIHIFIWLSAVRHSAESAWETPICFHYYVFSLEFSYISFISRNDQTWNSLVMQ